MAAAAAVCASLIGLLGVLLGLPLLVYLGVMAVAAIGLFFASRRHQYVKAVAARTDRALGAIRNDLRLAKLGSVDQRLKALQRDQSAFATATRLAESTLKQATAERNKLERDLIAQRRANELAREDLVAKHRAEVKKASSEALLEGAERFKSQAIARVAPFGASRAKVASPFGLTPDAFFGSQHHKDIRVLERIAMKMGSLRAREAIALSTTTQRNTLSEVLSIARSSQMGLMDEGIFAIVRSWELRSLLSLARVLADQSLLPEDRSDAVALYELAISAFGVKSIDERARYVYLETLQSLGESERLSDRISDFQLETHDHIQATLLKCNEKIERWEGTREAPKGWLSLLNEIYVNAGLSPVEFIGDHVDPEDADLLAALSAKAAPVAGGPLVSVMMATHNGSARIGTAIRSVLQQTWSNLELIIVDDFSDDTHWIELQKYASVDPRVQIYRLESNEGAYRARNLAFSRTRGEFVTVHDDDDWSHPQKIETQVRHLINNADVVGNMSMQSRISEDWKFIRINDNPRLNQRNYSSMMVRRNLVERLGSWDDINRAADAEFHDRVRAVTGQSIVGIESPPLSFMRARSGSLTAGEIRKGALDFARQTFGLLYGAWHQSLVARAQDRGDIQAPFTDPKKRPYAVPANMLPGQRVLSRSSVFDVVFITDFRFPGGNSSLIAVEIEAAHKAGLRIAIAQLDSPVLRANHQFNSTVHEVVSRLGVPILTLDDEVEVNLVVIRNPTVLQYSERVKPRFSAKNVVIIVNTAPMGPNGSNFCYDLDMCETSAANMFGSAPMIYPESPQTRLLNQGLFPSVNYSADDWTGFVEVESFAVEREIDPERRPVVGRHSRDHALKWPETASDVVKAYVQPDVFETRVLGGAASICALMDLDAESSVTVLPFGSQAPQEFLKTIDFWVYQHSSALTESFGMAVVEALASGAVTILPRYMKPLFGDAALYAEPEDVVGLVQRYWADTTLYLEQSERAREIVRLRFSSDAFISRLTGHTRDLLGAVKEDLGV